MAAEHNRIEPDEATPALFGHLLASRPAHNVRGSLTSTLTSLVLHAFVIIGIIAATMNAGEKPRVKERTIFTQLADLNEPLPPPPEPMLAGNVTAMAPSGFPTLPTPDVIPNVVPLETATPGFRVEDYLRPVGQAGGTPGGTGKDSTDDGIDAPYVVPVDVNPKLVNQAEVQKVVSRNYPSAMRDAGISGRTKLWIRVGEDGKPVAWQVKTGSGFDALDSAAARVAPSLRFTPALNLGRPVAVWISLDIVFTVR